MSEGRPGPGAGEVCVLGHTRHIPLKPGEKAYCSRCPKRFPPSRVKPLPGGPARRAGPKKRRWKRGPRG